MAMFRKKYFSKDSGSDTANAKEPKYLTCCTLPDCDVIIGIGQDIANIESDINDIENDINNINQDIVNINQDITNIENNIDSIETNIDNIEQDIVDINQDITDLQNVEFKITYYEIVSGTSGSITLPVGATLNQNEFGLSGNSILSKINVANKPTFESPETILGVVITANLLPDLSWTANGIFPSGDMALIYSIRVSAANLPNLNYDRIIESEEIDDKDWTQGGNSFGTKGILGTTDNQDLELIRNSVIFIKLKTGNVIGFTQLSGASSRAVEVDLNGDVSATKEFISAYISAGATATNLENTANWNIIGIYIGAAITGTYQGQKHYNADYMFECVADNVWIRLIRG